MLQALRLQRRTWLATAEQQSQRVEAEKFSARRSKASLCISSNYLDLSAAQNDSNGCYLEKKHGELPLTLTPQIRAHWALGAAGTWQGCQDSHLEG